MDSEAKDRLDKEIEIHRRLENEWVVKLEKFREKDGKMVLILEYCNGGSL